MNLQKYSKKSGKAIAKDYLNIVKFSKAFRILLLISLFSASYFKGRGYYGMKTLIAYCVIVLCLNHLARKKQMKEYSSLPLILTEMLDADKYLEVCLELSAKIKRTTDMAALNLANAYYWSGRYDEAKTILDNAVMADGSKANVILTVQYDIIYFNIGAKTGDMALCESLLARMDEHIEANAYQPRFAEILRGFRQNMEMTLALAKSEYEKCITIESEMAPAPTPINYVSRQYCLSECYLNIGSTNMAVNYLENTLSKAGNLYIQKQAKEKLHKLKGEN